MLAAHPIDMPKTGKPNSYWAGIMSLFAQGNAHFLLTRDLGADVGGSSDRENKGMSPDP